jgi:hypothetical protein
MAPARSLGMMCGAPGRRPDDPALPGPATAIDPLLLGGAARLHVPHPRHWETLKRAAWAGTEYPEGEAYRIARARAEID